MPRRLPPRRPSRKPTPPKGKKPTKYARSTKTRYANIERSKALSSMLNSVVETKVIGLTNYNEQGLIPIQLGAQTYQRSFVLGQIPTTWAPAEFLSLGGIPTNTGTGSQQITGAYAYLKNTTLNVRLDSNASQEGAVPCEARVIVYKAKRSSQGDNLGADPSRNLFLAPNATPMGWTTGGQNGYSLMMAPVNKRNFQVLSDISFLCQPHQAGVSGFNAVVGDLACAKKFQFRMPHNIKARISSGNITNYDPHYVMTILMRPIGHDGAIGPNLWEVNTRGSTSYMDA